MLKEDNRRDTEAQRATESARGRRSLVFLAPLWVSVPLWFAFLHGPTTLQSSSLAADSPPPKLTYEKKSTRHETIVASLVASGLPAFDGAWHFIGPFDNIENKGFAHAYPPEKEIDLTKSYAGKGGKEIRWQEYKKFQLCEINSLALFKENEHACVYLYHMVEAKEPAAMGLLLGSDDTLTVWLNGEKLLEKDVARAAAPDQDRVPIALKAGKNHLLIKVCNHGGPWAVYVRPEFPEKLEAQFKTRFARDFGGPGDAKPSNPMLAAEAKHYRIVTLPIPSDIVLEVGGLAFRSDGKLLCCTRRGDVWLISNPASEEPSKVRFHRFASGLHEALGLHVDGKDVYVVQRPELTKLIDRDGDDVAEEFVTVCDKWGVSGDYHEFAFGPARDKAGNFYVTLNVGFSGGHQSKAPWRGWCVKITPKGELIPFATGLRSPNGVAVSPEDDVFYCDNQGEWVATCKMHHVCEGDYFGHPAGLRWAKDSPFAKLLPPEKHASGMLYDGQAGKNGVSGMPPLTPPCIWFPYDRMGKSASEPIWDTTGGKFGPFAGQCFVGDQTKSSIMRVVLEKVNDRHQGACIPFRSGFECGINRLAFGPDGGLYAGMTNRGWGSVGGKPYGLQRLVYTGELPFEIHSMSLTKTGFDLVFTKPLEERTAKELANYSLQSHTYNYWSTYGSPEEDRRAEKISRVTLVGDKKRVSLTVEGLKPGRVYELHLQGVKSADGDSVLHPEAYYTLNHLR